MPRNFPFVLLLSVLFVNCSGNKSEKHGVPHGSAKSGDTTQINPDNSTKFSSYPNQVARFLAGQYQEDTNDISTLEKYPDWVNYKYISDSLWKNLYHTRLSKQIEWTQEELTEVNKKAKYIFYPFSGADFLNSNVFFPQAKKTLMIGLEPPGSLPDIKRYKKDSLERYFSNIRKSLYSILRFSFYQTKHMAKDFKEEELDGTLPNILIFMSRNHNFIMKVEPVIIDKKGKLYIRKFADFHKTKYNGIRVLYRPENNQDTCELIYFSVDISDLGLAKDSAFKVFLSNQKYDVTFLKSASYLMHKDYFSGIRNIILNQSNAVLQDDSGIPFRYFNQGNYSWKVFGTYDAPIKLFSNYTQKDYRKAFSDSTHVGKLPFGIGYDWKVNTSNLLLAVKNNPNLSEKK